MTTCLSCGNDVTGKKFCSQCGAPVQATSAPAAALTTCPRCNGEVQSGAAFCMHCGSALNAQSPTSQVAYAPPPPPSTRSCPACHAEVSAQTAFCTNCGHDMHAPAPMASSTAPAFCTNCGRQNAPGVRFCAGCGSPLTSAAAPASSMQSGQYPPQYPQYQQAQYQQSQYQQAPQYPQQYPQQYGQGGYQPQPMMGQQPMVLRCPTCMALAPLGTPNCPSCRTSLAGVVPTPASMPVQGQQGGLGGFLQGSGGQLAAGALGGAAAVIGGEMLLHGLENSIENRVEGDMGYGYNRHHHHHRREEGLLGELGDLANDIGL